MRTTLLRAAMLGALLLSAACSTLKVSVDYDPATDFSRYRTFTLKHGVAPNNPIAVDRLDAALEAAIVSRGLTRVPEAGELSIISHFKIGKETVVNTTTYGYGGWSGWYYGPMEPRAQTSTIREIPTGTVIVDVVDAKTGKAIWRGIAKDRITSSGTPEGYQKQAREVAMELFSDFPPARKK